MNRLVYALVFAVGCLMCWALVTVFVAAVAGIAWLAVSVQLLFGLPLRAWAAAASRQQRAGQ